MMTRMANRGLLAAFAASALALIAALLLVGSASANPASVTLGATAQDDGTQKVNITITPAGSEIVAGVHANITYDEAKLTASSCTPASTCNVSLSPGTVGVVMGPNLSGLSGVAGSVTFTPTAAFTSGSTDVGITISDCEDDTGTQLATCTATGTTITLATPTPTPSPSPSPAPATATPSPTPKALPQTGGPTGDSSSLMTWVLVAAGLIVVSGGVWAVSRARREI